MQQGQQRILACEGLNSSDQAIKVDIRLRVKGGGFTGQIYALRQAREETQAFSSTCVCFGQAVAKGIVAYYQKYIDEASKKEIKDEGRKRTLSLSKPGTFCLVWLSNEDILMAYDRSLIVADPRRCEPKKFGGNKCSQWSVSSIHKLKPWQDALHVLASRSHTDERGAGRCSRKPGLLQGLYRGRKATLHCCMD